MDTRKSHLLIQGVLLFIAVASTTLLAEVFLAGPILLAEGFKNNPLLYSSILLFLCLICFLCFAGSRMESRRVVQFFSRLLLIFFSISAGLFAFEFLSLGIMSVAVGDKASLDNYLPLIGFLPLMFFVAAGIKHAFGLRARYWIIVLVVFVAALLGVFLSQGVVFLA